jgi:PAS domain S-box-containing protein
MSKSAGKTILLVEDEAIIALAEKKTLESHGYSVCIVHTGEKALETVHTVPGIDLVLMDLDLGDGMDGIQAAETILQDHDVPIIFVSSHHEKEVVERTERVTSYGYIVKGTCGTAFDASIKMAFKLYARNKELSETRNKLKATLDAIPDLMFVMDRDGYFVDHHVRPDVHGTAIPADKIIGSHLRDIFSPEETAVHLALYRDCIDTGRMHTHTYTLDSDGTSKTYDLQLAHLDGNRVLAIVRDITSRKEAENVIKNLLAEKDLLLKEVHHRIKNSMSTVASLLGIQAASMEDPAAIMALEDARSRVRSMMLLYEKVYESSNFRTVALSDYLPSLVDEIIGNFPNRQSIRVEKDIQEFILDPKRLQPLGIILNELLTNVMKYAFRNKDSGMIRVSATQSDGQVVVTVQDDGNGLPESISLETSTGFGFHLVQALVMQLDGTIRLEREQGTRFVVEFPV